MPFSIIDSPVPRTVNAGNCDLKDHFFSPDRALKATNSPTEFLTRISEALTTALERTSPPIFFSQIIS